MKSAVYGIDTIKFADVPKDGTFPVTWTDFIMKAIVKDSVSFNDQAPSTTDIEVEDMDEYYATLNSDKGSKGFTVQTYDMSKEAYAFFCGYAEGTDDSQKGGSDNTGYQVETPGFVLENKAVQITTKKYGDFPARVFEWANMKLTVTQSGTIGKSGFPNLNIEFKKQAFINTDGEEVPGARWKNLPDK